MHAVSGGTPREREDGTYPKREGGSCSPRRKLRTRLSGQTALHEVPLMHEKPHKHPLAVMHNLLSAHKMPPNASNPMIHSQSSRDRLSRAKRYKLLSYTSGELCKSRCGTPSHVPHAAQPTPPKKHPNCFFYLRRLELATLHPKQRSNIQPKESACH